MRAQAIEDRSIDTIRMLAIDAVERAGSGHPGTPMAMAPVAYLLYRGVMRHDPGAPDWPDRDRFVLSAGHACLVQYAALHLTGYDLPLGEIERFRQWGSLTPGHPEREAGTPGIEVTTGPLGQGVGNAVGMALAERMLGERYNRQGFPVIDHRTWCICSDGDMMEGVASEAASLAGHLGLGRLCVIYDDNRITIEGSTSLAFSEDVAVRFDAYGWHVTRLEDGWGLDELRRAIAATRDDPRPSLVIARTHIATGAPHAQDTAEAHGAPLGAEEVRETKLAYGWDPDREFVVAHDVRDHMDMRAQGARWRREWEELFADYRAAHPDLAAELDRVLSGNLPPGLRERLPDLTAGDPVATRIASQRVIEALTPAAPELVGGSADLGPSTGTLVAGARSVAPGRFDGSILHFGVREHAMGAVLNGMSAHGGLRPFGATFLVFSDYMRPAIRLAAIMRLPIVYVFTHDSIALGEDGPTHQPVEQLAALRAIPGLRVVRPSDAAETSEAWAFALGRRDGPTAIVLSRQKVPRLRRHPGVTARGLARGGYIVTDPTDNPDVIAIGTGAEVEVAMGAADLLADDGISVRVVAMPCVELFLEQDLEYRERVLPRRVTRRVTVEAAVTMGWERVAGTEGIAIGVDTFGQSAPYMTVLERYGITAQAVAQVVRTMAREPVPS